jgi:hypothetical protein
MKRALLSVFVASRAFAFGAGTSGYSGKPPAMSCNDCHSGGTAPTSVMLSGPQTLGAGERATYTLDVVTAASNTTVGFDIATSAGTLGVIADQTNQSYLDGGEITHTKNWATGKTVQLMFTLTAPNQPGPVELYVNALASTAGAADTTASSAARGGTLEVSVGGAGDFGPPMDLSRMDAISSATSVMMAPPVDMGPPKNEPQWACAFHGSSRADVAPGALLLLAPLMWLARRRRR